jgi:PAS domain S-box-containing protein
MAKAAPLRFSLPLYLIPFLVGLCGVLLSNQFSYPMLKGGILFASVALPLFFGGMLLARLHMRGVERIVVGTGVILLLIGAAASLSDITQALDRFQDVPESITRLSRYIGIVSLVLGLFAVVFIVIRSDEAIEQIGARFKQLTEQIGEGLIFATAHGEVSMVNQRLLRLTGLSEADFVGKSVEEVPLKIDASTMLPPYAARETQGLTEYEQEWVREGKTFYFSVSVAPLYNRYNRLAGGFAIVRDITQQKRLAIRLENYAQTLEKLVEDRTEQLRKSENQLLDLLLTMSEGFVTVDASLTVQFANERILRILAVTREEFEGGSLLRFLDAPGRQGLMDAVEAAQSGQASRMRQELSLVRTDGVGVPVVIAVSPIPEGAREGARYSLVITDITEVKSMQEQLEHRAAEFEAANEELKLLDRAKDSLLANISHELRTPLSTVRGYVEMLSAVPSETLELPQRNALTVMARNVDRLGQLIDEIISFSRMQMRGINLSYSLFDANQLLQDCYNSAKPRLEARKLSLVLSSGNGLQFMWGDRKNLEQLLGILIVNAIKFSHEGGQIEMCASYRGHDACLAVKDNGIGIDPAFHRRIFDKFFQVDSSLSRRYEGVGIGLSIAKSIAEAHNGRIDLESHSGAGATFSVVIPNAAMAPETKESFPGNIGGRRLIALSEEAGTAHSLELILAEYGVSVTQAANPYECARLAVSSSAEAVVIDEAMSEDAATTAISKLQDQESTISLPVILLSNSETSADSIGPISNPVYRLRKPFLLVELLRVLELAFDGERPETALRAQSNVLAGGERKRSRVLVLDNDPDLLDWLGAALKRRNIDCACVSETKGLLDLLNNFSPHVVFVDADSGALSEPVVNMLEESCAALGARVYAMTAFRERGAAQNGFSGFVRKPFSVSDVLSIIGSAAGAESQAPPLV